MSTFRAETTENYFAFAKNAFTEGTRSRLGHVVPLDVLDIAAAVTDEVVMARAFRIKSRGTPLDSYFTYQAGLNQVPEIVIGCGPR